LQKFVAGVTDSDVYSTIASIFKEFGARFEEENEDEDLDKEVTGKDEGANQ
jgi:hypothetical protein